jgi:erythromycin esterase-like protein
MTTGAYDKRRLIEWLRAETARATGRPYQIDFDALDVQSLRELVRLVRLVRDFEHEKQAAVKRARMMPWRR